MRVKVWGCRGSVPTPGASTVRYGGNTSCVEVTLDDGSLLVLDAGTGIRPLGDELMEAIRHVELSTPVARARSAGKVLEPDPPLDDPSPVHRSDGTNDP